MWGRGRWDTVRDKRSPIDCPKVNNSVTIVKNKTHGHQKSANCVFLADYPYLSPNSSTEISMIAFHKEVILFGGELYGNICNLLVFASLLYIYSYSRLAWQWVDMGPVWIISSKSQQDSKWMCFPKILIISVMATQSLPVFVLFFVFFFCQCSWLTTSLCLESCISG